ncbi:MAG: hypothetical protein IT495_00885 [Gammaproteobacteria bacterium]|nr:hypothetical protein [Gammaproteobacteria bacterium]
MHRSSVSWPVTLVLAATLGGVPAAYAQPAPVQEEQEVLRGGELLSACRGGESLCASFIAGLVQTVSALQDMGAAPAVFCVDPAQVPFEDVRTRVVVWLEQHAGRLDEAAYVLATEALAREYPCRQSQDV